MTDDEKFWLEIRVPQNRTELEKANLETVVNFAFNRGSVLEFVVASTPSPRPGMDRNIVRWFLGLPDEVTQRDVRGHLEAEGFYVTDPEVESYGNEEARIDLDNLDEEYGSGAELQATDHFAYGFLPRPGEPEEERTFEEYPPVSDRLASAIFPEGALKVVFKRDGAARTEAIHRAKAERGEDSGPSFGFLDGFFRSLLGFGSGANWEKEEREEQLKNIESELEKKMKNRANSGLFAAEAYLYGSPDQINSVVHSLPLSPATLTVRQFGLTKGGVKGKKEKDPAFEPKSEPSRKRWRRTIKKWSPLIVLGASSLPLVKAWQAGLWDPLMIFESPVDFAPIPLLGVLMLLPYVLLDFKNPIVFSHDELTLFLSLPQKINNIPHEPGPEAEPTAGAIRKEGEKK